MRLLHALDADCQKRPARARDAALKCASIVRCRMMRLNARRIVHANFAGRAKMMGETNINHPPHYGGDTTYEAIKVIEAWLGEESRAFLLGNVLKYIARAGKKEGTDAKDDLRKALWYLARAAGVDDLRIVKRSSIEKAAAETKLNTDRGEWVKYESFEIPREHDTVTTIGGNFWARVYGINCVACGAHDVWRTADGIPSKILQTECGNCGTIGFMYTERPDDGTEFSQALRKERSEKEAAR